MKKVKIDISNASFSIPEVCLKKEKGIWYTRIERNKIKNLNPMRNKWKTYIIFIYLLKMDVRVL